MSEDVERPSGGDADSSLPAAHVSVVRGSPDDIELAALVAGLVAAASAGEVAVGPPQSPWSDHARRLRRPGTPGATALRGADTWRWSLRD